MALKPTAPKRSMANATVASLATGGHLPHGVTEGFGASSGHKGSPCWTTGTTWMPSSRKTLFQLQAERIRSLQQLAEARTGRAGKIAWYIMTSASTVEPTSDFFRQNNYFGLDTENVFIFQQGTLPCFTFEGKIILGEKGALSRAPDGNGGLYRALRNEGVLADMKLKGIKFIQLYCVDNVLVKVGGPVFMGYCLSKEAECANKVVRKGFPTEAVGITCKVEGHYQVVEYSEITQKSAEKRNKDGSLVYGAANICIHFFTFEFLERLAMPNEDPLQHYVAKKKIPEEEEEEEGSRRRLQKKIPEEEDSIKRQPWLPTLALGHPWPWPSLALGHQETSLAIRLLPLAASSTPDRP